MQGAGPGLACTLSRAIPGRWGPRSSTLWARSCTQWGRGVLQAAGAHFKVSSIIHRHLEELPARWNPAAIHGGRLPAPLAGCQRGPGCLYPGWEAHCEGKAPHAVHGERGAGPASSPPERLHGVRGPTPGCRYYLWVRVSREEGEATKQEARRDWARESGVGFGFHGQEPV